MVNHQKGLSLLEIMIAIGISMIGVVLALDVLLDSQRMLTASEQNANTTSELSLLNQVFQKKLHSDVKLFSFANPANGRALMRSIIPAPNKCADLSDCPGSSALTFASLSMPKVTQDGFRAVCAIFSGTSTTFRLILDGSAPTPQDFTNIQGNAIVTPRGQVEFAQRSLLAVEELPKALIFQVTAAPQMSNATMAGSPAHLRFGGVDAPSECEQNITRDNSGNLQLNRLVEVQVKPFVLTDVVGAATLSQADIRAAMGILPLSVKAVQLYSFGSLPSQSSVGLMNCQANNDSSIKCSGEPEVRLDNYKASELYFSYALLLQGTPVSTDRFLIGSNESANCTSPTCHILPTASWGQYSIFASTSESFEDLDGSLFSFLKQEALTSVTFGLTSLDGKHEELKVSLRSH